MNGLVKGYMRSWKQGSEIWEVLFAVTYDGRIFQSNPHKMNCNFDQKDRSWHRTFDFAVRELEGALEFIGNYPFPKNVTKWA